jgi:hypothetical protein
MAALASMQTHKQFFSKNTDTNLSALFAFFRLEDSIKSALAAQKRAFFTLGVTDYCFTLLLPFHRNSGVKLYCNTGIVYIEHRFGFILPLAKILNAISLIFHKANENLSASFVYCNL